MDDYNMYLLGTNIALIIAPLIYGAYLLYSAPNKLAEEIIKRTNNTKALTNDKEFFEDRAKNSLFSKSWKNAAEKIRERIKEIEGLEAIAN